MKKIIKAVCGNGYVGCDTEDVFIFDVDTTDKEISEELYSWACENAESFAHVHFGWDGEYTNEEYEDYIENNVTLDYGEISFDEYFEFYDNQNMVPPLSRKEIYGE